MTPFVLFYIIVGIVVLHFCFTQWIEYLNTTMWSNKLPEKLHGFYDAETYSKQQLYEKQNYKIALIGDIVAFFMLLAMLFFDGFAWLDSNISLYVSSPMLKAVVFFGVLALVYDIVSIPFEIYHTFVIEEKFGFNNTVAKTFVADKLKGWILSALIGGILITTTMWLWQQTGAYFWLPAWGIISLFSVGMGYFYASVLLPVFNKLTPLTDGTLKNAIELMAQKTDFGLKNIKVMDGSKRSSKANAFFSGFGKRKTIVLFDTLISNHSENEILAVLAHEIGHYKKKHIIKGIAISIAHTGIVLLLLSLFLENEIFNQALGVENNSFHISFLLFGILYTPIATLLGIFTNKLSRKNEYEADKFAAENANVADMQNALKKLSVQNLSNLTPHYIYVSVHYSHPPLLQRLEALDKLNKT